MSKLSRNYLLMGVVADKPHRVMYHATMEVIGNKAAAAHVGVSVNAWRPYVARGQAPEPVRREIRGGHALPVWTTEQLDEWQSNRPGRGAPGRPRRRAAA